MTEHPLNEYSWQMNLTVHSLEKRDFGGYVCSSVNALGKFDGVVRLQGTENFPLLSKIVFSSAPISLPLLILKRRVLRCIRQYLKITFHSPQSSRMILEPTTKISFITFHPSSIDPKNSSPVSRY